MQAEPVELLNITTPGGATCRFAVSIPSMTMIRWRTPTQTTWYYVQITDRNGCTSNVDSLLVTVLPKPIVDAGPDKYICVDSAPCKILDASVTGAPGPFSYQWSPSAGLSSDTVQNPCARPDTTTIYTLVVTSLNGCQSNNTTVDTNSSVTVHINPLPVADAGPDHDICFGDSVELPGIGYGAGPNYNYQWSPQTHLSDPGHSQSGCLAYPKHLVYPGGLVEWVSKAMEIQPWSPCIPSRPPRPEIPWTFA